MYRTARIDDKEEPSIEDYPRSNADSTQGRSASSLPPDVRAQHKRGQDRSRRCRNVRSEKAATEGSSCAADNGTRGNITSVGNPLGVRDINSRSTRGHVSPSTCAAGSAGTAATPVTLIRDPFSPDERRKLTTNTTSYKHWARSSSIVRDTRQDPWERHRVSQLCDVSLLM